MSDTALNRIIRYGTEADRLAFTPNPASGSQILYLWYQTDTTTEPIGLYAWLGSSWILVNPLPGTSHVKRQGYVIFQGNNNTPSWAGLPTMTISGTMSNGSDGSKVYTRVSTAAITDIGLMNTGVLSRAQWLGQNGTYFRANIKTGPSINNIRLWIFLGDTSGPVGGSDSSNAHYIAFRYSTVASDPGFVGICCNGTAANQQITSGFAAIAIDTAYQLEFRRENNVISFYVNDVHIGDLSTNMPTNPMLCGIQMRNTVAEAKQLLMNFLYVEGD